MRRIFRVCSQKHTFADFSSPCSFAPDAIKRNCSLFSFPRVQIPTFSRETTMLPSGGGIGFTEVTQLKMRMCTLGKRCARSCFVPPAPWRPKKSRRALQILAAVVSLKDGLHQVDFLRCWPRVCRLHFGAFYPRKKSSDAATNCPSLVAPPCRRGKAADGQTGHVFLQSKPAERGTFEEMGLLRDVLSLQFLGVVRCALGRDWNCLMWWRFVLLFLDGGVVCILEMLYCGD